MQKYTISQYQILKTSKIFFQETLADIKICSNFALSFGQRRVE